MWVVDTQQKGEGAPGGGRGLERQRRPPSQEPVRGGKMKRTSMTVYDYVDRPKEIQLPDKDIKLLYVAILSGDETGYVQFEDGTILEFDASDSRWQDFFDGSYTVSGDKKIEEWIDWKPKEGEGAFERMDMMYKD